MEGFTYTNIFDTKGIEYLVIIAFLILLIPFWILLNKPAITKKIKQSLGILTAGILRIPQGLLYSRNHTWTHLEKSGNALVGIDDWLVHITGNVKVRNLKNPGDLIKKGEILAELDQNGKLLQINSPVSGKILRTNAILEKTPEILAEDPYDKGWVYKIKPSDWIAETSSCYVSEDATNWSNKELERFKDFLSAKVTQKTVDSAFPILLDGGEISDNPLSELNGDVWKDFQKGFLV